VEKQFHAFLTSELDGSKFWPVFPDGKHSVPTGYEAGWAPEPVSMLWRRERFLFHAGNQIPIRPII
jgi:hypothetical protein